MWDTYQLPTIGNFSLRKIALSLLTVLTAAFLWTILFSPTARAADVTWQGDNLLYQGQTYKPESAPIPGVPQGWSSYVYQAEGSPTAQVISVPPGSDKTKPINNAELRTVTKDGNQYSSPGPPTVLLIDPYDANNQREETQCDTPGVGWIICPFSNFIANAMDNFFSWIKSYLSVEPITDDTDSAMYQAWSAMLNLANMAFVLAFLLIVYSQITGGAGGGLSNYNMKKILPRLIVAAVLVNVSYYICAIAVDISNIAGVGVQQGLEDIRKSLPVSERVYDNTSWQNLTEYILSAGTVGAAAFAGYAAFAGATGGMISALVPLLVPVLVAGILILVVTLLVLAARQAMITVLIIVAPLAFVAYLLPNTEKWFERWRGLFITMLLVFPLFSLLYGGSQLASYVILQGATQISVVILGMFVQVVPLAITPFLIKFSGSLLGRIVGTVNDKSKGIYDNANNWAKEKADAKKGKAQEWAAHNPHRRMSLRRMAYKRELSRMDREAWKKRGETALDAGWHEDARYQAHHLNNAFLEDRKKTAEARSNEHVEREAARSQTWQDIRGARRMSESATKNFETQEEARWEEMLSRNMQPGNQFARYARDARDSLQEQRIAEGRVAAAEAMQKIEHANDLIKSEDLQVKVGGIADHGAQRALAKAVSEYRKDYNDRIDEATAILKHYNLSGAQRQDHALGKTIEVYDENGNMKILRKDSLFTREAAIETQLATGTYAEIEQIVQRSGSELEPFKTTIAAGIASNKLSGKAVFLGGKTIDDTGQGKITDMQHLMEAVTATIARGKISANDLATNENTALQRVYEAALNRNLYRGALSAEDNAALDANIERLKESANQALTHPTISRDLRENARQVLENIRNL